MNSLLYLISIFFVIGWAVGFFVFSAGWLIHILLIMGLVSLLLGIVKKGLIEN